MSRDSRFVEYYSDPSVRDKLLSQRRALYAENPAVRAAQLERVRARRAAKKPEPTKKRSPNQRRVFEVSGFPVLMVSLGEAAQLVGLSKKCFRTLDVASVIPCNRLTDRLGRRWYPSDYVEWLVPLLSEQGKKREPRWLLKERVEQAWQTTSVTKIGDLRESSA